MQGVTAAIVAFIFVCVLFPRLIASRTQFYGGFAVALVVILLDGVGQIAAPGTSLRGFAYLTGAVLQVAAIGLLFLAAGGLTWRGLSSEMLGAFEVLRRGETEKEVIIPIGKQRERLAAARGDDAPPPPPRPAPPPRPPADEDDSIPFD